MNSTSGLPCTSLMSVNVVAILPPVYQSYIRSAGSVGTATYEEVIAQGRGLVWIETPVHPCASSCTTLKAAPCGTLPLKVSGTLVVTHQYLLLGNNAISLIEVPFGDTTTQVRYIAGDDVVEIPHMALSQTSTNYKLESIELSGFKNVRTILRNFMGLCSSLKSIDLTPLSNVTSVGGKFLDGCLSLTTLDLGPLRHVKSIGFGFLGGCTNLTSVSNFDSSWDSLEEMEWSFMQGCSSLTSLDLSPLRNVKGVSTFFLAGCFSLESIDLSPLSCNLVKVDEHFLEACTSLTTINLTPLKNVAHIGAFFLMKCVGLKEVDVSPIKDIPTGAAFMTREYDKHGESACGPDGEGYDWY